ncbi:MAG: class I SAM-dependent methyltransferase [Actinomycetota bacterium]
MEISRDEQFDLELLGGAVRYQRWVLSAFEPVSGSVVEVGAGSGNMTRWLSARADRVVAVEPHPALAERIEALQLPNVDVLRTRIEDLPEDASGFDLAVSVNVLEHIEDDEGAVRAMARLVRPGGRLAILVPAHRLLSGKLDRRYHHLRRYSRRGVAALLDHAGVEIERVRYFNPLGAIGWLLFVRLLGRTRLSAFNIWATERIAVPTGQALERIGFHPFGQSVIAIGRRPMHG